MHFLHAEYKQRIYIYALLTVDNYKVYNIYEIRYTNKYKDNNNNTQKKHINQILNKG